MLKPIYILGDTHGDMACFARYVNKYKIEKCTIVHVGDFGFSIDAHGQQTEDKYSKSLAHYNKMFSARDITMYVIRGNHDDPAYFDGRFMLSNLKLLKDYTTLELNGQTWLFVGGALSVDRWERKWAGGEGKWWFADEKFVLNKLEIDKLPKIDVVVTHTAPETVCSYELVGRSEIVHHMVAKGDHSLLTELWHEQKLLQELYDILEFQGSPLTNWYFGHFHKSVKDTYKHTKFRCMAIDELDEHRS